MIASAPAGWSAPPMSSGVIDAGYCMIMTDGEVVAGRCVSTPSMLPDGRIPLTERWHRIDGSSGISRSPRWPSRRPASAGSCICPAPKEYPDDHHHSRGDPDGAQSDRTCC